MARQNVMERNAEAGHTWPSYVTSETRGDKGGYRTTLTLNTTLGAIAGGANLALGKLIMTFPAGRVFVERSAMNVAIKQSQGNITADTPDVGVGTTLASGVQALLSGVGAASENMITGQTATDCNGTAIPAQVDTFLSIATADNHTVYLNVADGWAASGDTGAYLSGTVDIFWQKLD